jgi:hypothetical protein
VLEIVVVGLEAALIDSRVRKVQDSRVRDSLVRQVGDSLVLH